jgi:hypothetical protein
VAVVLGYALGSLLLSHVPENYAAILAERRRQQQQHQQGGCGPAKGGEAVNPATCTCSEGCTGSCGCNGVGAGGAKTLSGVKEMRGADMVCCPEP